MPHLFSITMVDHVELAELEHDRVSPGHVLLDLPAEPGQRGDHAHQCGHADGHPQDHQTGS